MKIVIAEDEYIEREALQKILNQNYGNGIEEIFVCKDGCGAVKLVHEKRPDIIFMDIEMPLKNGIDASEEIRCFNQEVQIVMVTAYSTFEYAQKSIRNGVVDYIVKPYSVKTICRLMDKLVENLQKEEAAKRAAERLHSMLTHEFIMSLLVNDELPKEKKQEYIKILELENTWYFVSVIVSGETQEWEKYKVKISRMSCYLYGCQFIIYYAQDRTYLEPLRSDILATGGPAGNLESQWNLADEWLAKINQALITSNSDESETMLKRHLYAAIINRDEVQLESYANRLIWVIGENNQKLTAKLVELFEEIMQNVVEINAHEKDQLWQVLDIRFSDSYSGNLKEAQEELCRNCRILIEYLEKSFRNKNHRMIEQAKKYIQDNYARDISLEDIAAFVAISKFYLSRMFKEVTGENLKDYLLNYRINQAKHLLRSGHNVSETAYSTGFSDPAYFSKCFKKITGYTPGVLVGK